MPLIIPPFGISPLGTFTPTLSQFDASPPPAVLADNIDYQTREYASLDDGMDPIDEQVLIALSRIRRSGAAIANVGHRFNDIEKLDEATPARVQSEVAIALQRLIARGDIRLVSSKWFPSDAGDGGDLEVRYFNLRAQDVKRLRNESVKVNNVRDQLR